MKQVIYYLAALALSVAPLYALTLAGENLPAVSDNVMNEPPPQTESVGWIDKGRYKELKAHNNGVASLRVTEDGKRIISVSGNEYKVWELETGILLKEYNIPSKGLYTVRILDDSSVIAMYPVSSKDSYGNYYIGYVVGVKIFNIYHDKVIREFSFSGHLDASTFSVGSSFFYAKIDKSNNALYFSHIYQTEHGSRSYRTNDYKGSLQKIVFNGDIPIITGVSPKPISFFSFIKDNKIIALENNFGAVGTSNGYVSFGFNKRLVIGDKESFNPYTLDESTRSNSNLKPREIFGYKVLSSKNLIAEFLYKDIYTIFFRDMDEYNIIDSCNLPALTTSYEFSLNGNNILTSNKNGIYIYSVPEISPIDSFPIPSGADECSFVLLNDSVTFIAGSSDGYIRLFKSDVLKGGPVSVDETSERGKLSIVYPNPAGNELFLQKNEALLGSRVEIYSPTGVKAFEVPYAQRIDISALPAGMYFIRAGGEYSKFIKK